MSNAITKVQNANARRGGDVLLEVLESEGVEYVFGNPGTTELPFMDALLRKPSIQYVLALQEASAVAMADGYAQAAKNQASESAYRRWFRPRHGKSVECKMLTDTTGGDGGAAGFTPHDNRPIIVG